MDDNTTRHDASPTRLWGLDDLATYIGCSDARPTTRLAGFPPELTLPGVRGPRWHGPAVIEFFASLAASDNKPITTEAGPVRLPSLDSTALAARLAMSR